MSGLSEPYLSMASYQLILGSGSGISTPRALRNICLIIPSNMPSTSSCSTKLISQSIWVNSGWRSARRSSSRKHLTIWK